jgi:hypothetical protein
VSEKTNNPIKNLPPPSETDWRVEDKQHRETLQQHVDTWMEEIQKDISELLKERGIEKFQLSFIHKGTNSPMMMIRGGLFECAKLAVSAANELKKQVAEHLR